mmetsp:Transcript_5357/g.11765  ORF Transcript_5357/g.11765 Transcript_5357/m.11765 type:complete len:344 (-) Transcript_5357:780-1811(-)
MGAARVVVRGQVIRAGEGFQLVHHSNLPSKLGLGPVGVGVELVVPPSRVLPGGIDEQGSEIVVHQVPNSQVRGPVATKVAQLHPPRLLPLQRRLKQRHWHHFRHGFQAGGLGAHAGRRDDLLDLVLGSSDDNAIGHHCPVVVVEMNKHLLLPAKLQLSAVVVKPHRRVRVLQHITDDPLVAMGDIRLFLVAAGVELHLLHVAGDLRPRWVDVESTVGLEFIHLFFVESEMMEKAQLIHVAEYLVLERVKIGLGYLRVTLLHFPHQILLELGYGLLLIKPHRVNWHVGDLALRHLTSVVEPVVIGVPLLSHVCRHILQGVPPDQLPHSGVPLLKVPTAAELFKL